MDFRPIELEKIKDSLQFTIRMANLRKRELAKFLEIPVETLDYFIGDLAFLVAKINILLKRSGDDFCDYEEVNLPF